MDAGTGGGQSEKDLYNIDTQEEVVDHICGFDGILKFNYFGREPIRRAEVEAGERTLKNRKAKGKDEVMEDNKRW